MAKAIDQGIKVQVIGDSGPFSRMGRSIGYLIMVKGHRYLVDLGAPVFQLLGIQGIGAVRGVICTHSHDDHKRWFTDVALFKYYNKELSGRLPLITTETIHEEYEKNAKGALERSLSEDSRDVVEIPYSRFVEQVLLGPRSIYRIVARRVSHEDFHWRVVDSSGEIVDPRKAKVVVHPHANRPRLLLRDSITNEWVEPESFYVYGDTRFYDAEQNPYVDNEVGVTFRAVKGPCWHGPPNFSVEVCTDAERVLFSSDTVYDVELWHQLANERRTQKLGMSRREFEQAYVVYGNINDLIERTWSQERLEEALRAYDEGIVIHDADVNGSVVHTSYSRLAESGHRNLLLTHGPDIFVSALPLSKEGKTFRVIRNTLYEEVDGHLWEYDADVYAKDDQNFWVGYTSKDGAYSVVEKHDGMLGLCRYGDPCDGVPVMRVDLYADFNGKYFPAIDVVGRNYRTRPDGQVEEVRYTPQGSRGQVMKDFRPQVGRAARRRKRKSR